MLRRRKVVSGRWSMVSEATRGRGDGARSGSARSDGRGAGAVTAAAEKGRRGDQELQIKD